LDLYFTIANLIGCFKFRCEAFHDSSQLLDQVKGDICHFFH
jgi:hypothetical protein